MKLRSKLLIPPLFTALMLILVLGVALKALDSFRIRSQASQVAMIAGYDATVKLQTQLGDAHIDLYRTMAVVNLLSDAKVKSLRAERGQGMAAIADATMRNAGSTAAGTLLGQALQKFTTQLRVYQLSSDTAIELSTEAPNAKAMGTADADFNLLNATLAEVVALVKTKATEESGVLAADALRQATLVGVLGLLAASLSVVFAWTQQRRIQGQVQAAVQAAESVAAGELDVEPHSEERDEIGDLVRSLGSMVGRLRSSLESVQSSSESIRVASREIAAGNLDLSQRTELSSSNLLHVATSIDQLSKAVHHSAESAQQAHRLVSSTAEVAARGGTVVAKVVSTMAEINTGSRHIADIVSVIDGIAAQTSILALNAAVEASRAGEAGRGFAVVAGEVRLLAGRSATAAREIKRLITTSVDKVESGAKLVGGAGSTMTEIVNSVQHVSAIVTEIAATAPSLSNGVGQANASLSQLEEITQRNAALAEQSAAAAESLSDHATRLAEVVGYFKLGSFAPTERSTPHTAPLAPRAASLPLSKALG